MNKRGFMSPIMRKITKLGGITNIFLALIYLAAGIFMFANNQENYGLLGVVLCLVFGFMGVKMIQITKTPKEFKILMEILAQLIHKLPAEEIKNDKLTQLIFLVDQESSKNSQKRLLSPFEWSYSRELNNKAVDLALEMTSKLKNLKTKGLDVTMMIPPVYMTESELELVQSVIESHKDKTYGDLNLLIHEGEVFKNNPKLGNLTF